MWTFEASAVYKWYSSIAEKGTSVRAHFSKKAYLSTISAARYELRTNGPAAIFLIPMLFA